MALDLDDMGGRMLAGGTKPKFSCDAGLLAGACAAGVAIVQSAATVPILEHVLVEAGTDRVRVTACDLEREVASTFPAEVDTVGAVCLPGRVLAGLANKLPKDRIIVFEPDGHKMLFRVGNQVRGDFNALEAADFPTLTRGLDSAAVTFSANADVLARLFNRVAYARGRDETRWYLNGVYFHTAEGHDGARVLRCVATDGHRLALADAPVSEIAGDLEAVADFAAIIPSGVVALLPKLIANCGDVTVEIASGAMRLVMTNTVLTSKLVDGTYPDYGRVIPKNEVDLEVDRAELSEAVSRSALLASKDTSTNVVTVTLDDTGLTVGSKNHSRGGLFEAIDVGWEGDVREVGFSRGYLSDTLAAFPGVESLSVALGAPGDPVVFHDAGDPHGLHLVMPRRVEA